MEPEKKYRHIIITFFNFPRFGKSELFWSNPQLEKILSPDWLTVRLNLFKHITLPSIKYQTVQKFDWFIIFHPKTPSWFRNKIEADLPKNCHPIYASYWQSFIYDKLQPAKDERFLITRLDSDDALQQEAIEDIQEFFTKSDQTDAGPYIIDFQTGYKLDTASRCLHEYRPVNPTSFCTKSTFITTPLDINTGGNHVLLKKTYPYLPIPNTRPKFVMSIHQTNLINRLDPSSSQPKVINPDVSKEILNREFGIDSELIKNETGAKPPTKIKDWLVYLYKRLEKLFKKPIVIDTNNLTRVSVIQSLIDRIGAKNYLEIGIREGYTFKRINCREKIAVDPVVWETEKMSADYLFQGESDEFFSRYQELLGGKKLDIIFVDGLHTYQQSLKDVLNGLEHLSQKGIIVVHDCSPRSATAAHPVQSEARTMEGYSGEWNGDAWKTIVRLRSMNKGLKIFTLDCDYGLGIITWGNLENTLRFSPEEIDALTYDDLKKDRPKLLNLRQPSYFKEFLNALS